MNKRTRVLTCALVILASACSHAPDADKDARLNALKQQKQLTDARMSDKNLEVWVKVKGKNALQKVEGRRYPRNIEYTYNTLKDEQGRYLYIAQLPFSETNDWFISYKSYFDSTGNLYAFQRINNFLKSECVRGALMENMLKIFDRGAAIDSVYTLSDTYKKPVSAEGCKFPYNFPYSIEPNLEAYKKRYMIP